MQPIISRQVPDVISNSIYRLPRTLKQDISAFGDLLAGWDDELAGILKVWQKNCIESLSLGRIDHERALNTFLDQLVSILTVPGMNVLMDEESMLGSDGRVYPKKFLCLHRHHSQAPYNLRSPLKSEDPRPFMVRAHEPVRVIVKWFKKYRPDSESSELDSLYSRLPEEKKVLREVSKDIQEIRLIQFARRQQEEFEKQRQQEIVERLNIMIDKVVEPKVDAIVQNVVQYREQAKEKLIRQEQSFREQEQVIRLQLHQTEEEIKHINSELIVLNQDKEKIENQIDECKKDNIKLEIAIKETERAIKERDKGWFKDLLTFVAVAAASWAATWALGQLAQMAKVAAKPVISATPGGLKGSLVFNF